APRAPVLSLLQHEEDVEVVGECGDGTQAVVAIQSQAPDLVFLDVQMPGHNGFEVIEAVGADRMPTVIFVTAYDEYALRAFEVHAPDYLLKPFGRDRFQQTLQHARAILERRRAGDLGRRLLALVNDIKTEPGPTRLGRLGGLAPGRRKRNQDRAGPDAVGPSGGEVRRTGVLPADRSDRLDRGRRQ